MARGKAYGQRAFVPRELQDPTVTRTPPEDDWRREAVCAQVDPEIWFPEKCHSEIAAKAKKLCGTCPVRQECLTEALAQDQRFGVWGGATERTRRDLHKAVNHGADPRDVAMAHLYGQEALRRWAG